MVYPVHDAVSAYLRNECRKVVGRDNEPFCIEGNRAFAIAILVYKLFELLEQLLLTSKLNSRLVLLLHTIDVLNVVNNGGNKEAHSFQAERFVMSNIP